MIKSTERGWDIFFNPKAKTWLYCDTGKPIDGKRFCQRCGRPPAQEGYDACLGYIPGVHSACCGHGKHQGFKIIKYPSVNPCAHPQS